MHIMSPDHGVVKADHVVFESRLRVTPFLLWPYELINYTASMRIHSISSKKPPLSRTNAPIHQEGIKHVLSSVIKKWSEGA